MTFFVKFPFSIEYKKQIKCRLCGYIVEDCVGLTGDYDMVCALCGK